MAVEDANRLRVLILTGQQLLADMLKLAVNQGIYVTREARGVDVAQTIIRDWNPRLAIVDMEIGDDLVVQKIGAARSQDQSRLPVLALTRRGDLKTKLAAFDQGAEDIMTIPLSPDELLARVTVIMRRCVSANVSHNPRLKLGDLEVDVVKRCARVGAAELQLTGLEQSLLYFLAANAGKVVTRDQIMDALWGTDFSAESNVVDRHIRSLRIKLQDNWKHPKFIATVPGEGYRFLLSPELEGGS